MKTNNSRLWKIIGAFSNKIPERAKGYVKENWGAPFILGFMALLLLATVLLLMDFAVLANASAVYAFYALVVGLGLQLFCFLKYCKGEGEQSK